jgi:hypothetical protein
VVGGTSLGLLAVLTALTGRGFVFHTVTSNVNEFRWEQVFSYLAGLQALMPLLLVSAGAFVVLGLRSRGGSWWLVSSYLLGGLATAGLIGKVGSDVNYLLELCVALALAAGALLARCAARPSVRAAMLVALTVQVVLMVQTSQFFYADLQGNVIEQREEMAQLAETVRESEGPVLDDEQMGLLPLEGRRIYIQPFEFSQLSREGKWNEQSFVEEIQRAEFEAILIFEPPGASGLVEDRWTPRMLREIEAHYEPAETVADTTIYRPG